MREIRKMRENKLHVKWRETRKIVKENKIHVKCRKIEIMEGNQGKIKETVEKEDKTRDS